MTSMTKSKQPPQPANRVLLDTNILIGFLRDKEEAVETLTKLRKKRTPCISVITIVEVRVGCGDITHREQIDNLLSGMSYLTTTPEIASIASRLLRPYIHDKSLLAALFPDALIAATAEHHKIDIYTGNLKHFGYFELRHSQVHGY